MRWLFVVPLAFLISCGKSPTAQPASPPIPRDKALVWSPENPIHTVTNGEIGVRFTFTATNITSNEVVIDEITPSCGCTVAEMPSSPWRIKPHGTGQFDAVMDIREKTGVLTPGGVIYKSIEIYGDGFTNDLKITVAIPPTVTANLSKVQMDRLFAQQLASIDHQAVFKRDCVQCHMVPNFGKYDANLYHSACGICHESPERASFVPDLASLKGEIDSNYWHDMVAKGKPGTLMPGFASSEGGPLDADQVNSLVAFLQKTFPRPIKGAATNSTK